MLDILHKVTSNKQTLQQPIQIKCFKDVSRIMSQCVLVEYYQCVCL